MNETLACLALALLIDALAVWAATRKPRARRWPWLTRGRR